MIYGLFLLLSLLFMRILTMIYPHLSEMIPLRIMLGFAMIFNFLLPLIIVYYGFSSPCIHISVIVPFTIHAVMYPFFDSISLGNLLLMVDPVYIIPLVTIGLGFGIVGCGSYFKKKDPVLSPICLICGFLVILLSVPNLIPVAYFVVSGDYQILETIQNFL